MGNENGAEHRENEDPEGVSYSDSETIARPVITSIRDHRRTEGRFPELPSRSEAIDPNDRRRTVSEDERPQRYAEGGERDVPPGRFRSEKKYRGLQRRQRPHTRRSPLPVSQNDIDETVPRPRPLTHREVATSSSSASRSSQETDDLSGVYSESGDTEDECSSSSSSARIALSEDTIISPWSALKSGDLNTNTSDARLLTQVDVLISQFIAEFQLSRDTCDFPSSEDILGFKSPLIRNMIEELDQTGVASAQPSVARALAQCQIVISNVVLELALSSPLATPEFRAKNTVSVLKLVQTVYDSFWIGCSARAVCTGDTQAVDPYPHPISIALSGRYRNYKKGSDDTPKTRCRLDAAEYLVAVLCTEARKEMDQVMAPLAKSGYASVVIAVPQRYLVKAGSAKEYYDPRMERQHIARACMIAMTSPNKMQEIAKYGIQMMPVTKEFFDSLGQGAQQIIEDITLLNVLSVLPIVFQSADLYKVLLTNWFERSSKCIYQTKIGEDVTISYHKQTSSRRSRRMEMVIGPFVFANHDVQDTIMTLFSRCHSTHTNIGGVTFYSIAPTIIDIASQRSIRNVTTDRGSRSIRMIPYTPTLDLACLSADPDDAENFYAFMSGMFFCADFIDRKSDLSKLFVIKGILESAPIQRTRQLNISMNNYVRASVISFIVANMRFVPSFEISMAMIAADSSVRCERYSVDFYDFACQMTFDAYSYSKDGKSVVISFPITIGNIMTALSTMTTGSSGGGLLPQKNEELVIPTHWMGEDVKRYASGTLSESVHFRGNNGVISIKNMRIYSMQPSETEPNLCALVSSNSVKNLPIIVPHKTVSRTDAPGGQETALRCLIRGHRLFLGAPIAGKIDSGYLTSHDRTKILREVTDNSEGPDGVNILHISRCAETPAIVCIRNVSSVIHESTGIQCATGFTICIKVDMIENHRTLEEWSSLYGFWSISSYRAIGSLSMPAQTRFPDRRSVLPPQPQYASSRPRQQRQQSKRMASSSSSEAPSSSKRQRVFSFDAEEEDSTRDTPPGEITPSSPSPRTRRKRHNKVSVYDKKDGKVVAEIHGKTLASRYPLLTICGDQVNDALYGSDANIQKIRESLHATLKKALTVLMEEKYEKADPEIFSQTQIAQSARWLKSDCVVPVVYDSSFCRDTSWFADDYDNLFNPGSAKRDLACIAAGALNLPSQHSFQKLGISGLVRDERESGFKTGKMLAFFFLDSVKTFRTCFMGFVRCEALYKEEMFTCQLSQDFMPWKIPDARISRRISMDEKTTHAVPKELLIYVPLQSTVENLP